MVSLDHEAKEKLIRFALDQGFDDVRISSADFGSAPGENLENFLKENRHGDMDWLLAKKDWRQHPQSLWGEARSAIMVGLNYGPSRDPRALADHPERGIISVYAQGKDYHDVVKKRLKRIARWMVQEFGADVKVFVDTAPVMEKPLAAAAGLGWQGKHTNLLSRRFGSWLFLGAILTTADITPDAPETGDCGRCTACLDACPTNAFPAPYQLDARRCISYLTIETRAHIPREFRAPMENRIYGCDDCLAACPWNKFAKASREMAFLPRSELTAPRLADLAALDDTAFREVFSGSPIKRLGRNRFVRNVLIALGNAGDKRHKRVAERLLEDESPIVRLAAVWALSRLADPAGFIALYESRYETETDPDVRAEWKISRQEKQ
ncbi:MAG: tRNA epoxyqueuosine(34) reductase QueG [Sneathiellales bacterium]|nr:tRNA epoxyqueuosine(34) reductase QueG [Sneathiellales bacterium]